MSSGNRSWLGLILGGVAAGLVLVGAGIGIGAAVWSGGSSTPPLGAANPRPFTKSPGKRTAYGDYPVKATLYIFGEDRRGRLNGKYVAIHGGGGGTSNCTSDETQASFTVSDTDYFREFGFTARTGGGCGYESSWSYFNVSVQDSPDGKVIGSARLWLGQDRAGGGYYVACAGNLVGLTCRDQNLTGFRNVFIDKPAS